MAVSVAFAALRRIVESVGVSSLLMAESLEACKMVKLITKSSVGVSRDDSAEEPATKLKRSGSTASAEDRAAVAALLGSYVALERAAPALLLAALGAIEHSLRSSNASPVVDADGDSVDPFETMVLDPGVDLIEQTLRALADAGALTTAACRGIRLQPKHDSAICGGEMLIHCVHSLATCELLSGSTSDATPEGSLQLEVHRSL